MRLTGLICGAIALCLPLGAAAAVTPAQVQALSAAIEKAGCTLTADNAGAVRAAAKLSEAEIFEAVEQLYNQGLARLEPGGATHLLIGACK